MTVTAWRVSDEVAAAVASARPVVALETAIVTHGLPHPTNVETALGLQADLRRHGVVPASVGVVNGVPTVGLADEEIEHLGTAQGVAKASTRDLPVLVSRRADAGTTVSATAVLARRAGIRVFATGGIGGVHRGAATSFDESTDLTALAHTAITVVCAGIKSILDVPATLERLESYAVTVVGFRTDRFPGFFVADSGSAAPARVDSAADVADVMRAADSLGLTTAVVVANPVPVDEQLDPEVHARAVQGAVDTAARLGVHGQALTPFLLDHLDRGTGGASVRANLAAVRNNVAVAGSIAKAWVAS
ncbi:MAG TPA: pseudouridine-5'-phosphate glycosidase [Acidimicrobiales bacterium]|nr:pseudouridine-5'-phosphate glycosidase [Acidimicrobiales bacterium]